MIWADKIALALLVLVALLLFLAGAGVVAHDLAWLNAYVTSIALISVKFLLPLWIGLRLLAAICTPKRKRS